MPTRWTIAALCVLLGALAAHARILDVRGVGADDDNPTTPPTTESTAAPPTTPSSNVDPYCLTCDGVNNQRYQLIRGEGEVDKCKEQIYCDCIEHTLKKCEGWPTAWGLAFNPEKQECTRWFSCESWLNQHTSTTAPPTSTAPTETQPTVTEPTVPPPTATASTAIPTIAPAPTATSTIAPAPTVTQTTSTRAPTAAPQTGSPGTQTTTGSPGTQKTPVTPGPPPTPVPVPSTTPSSAWANKATALTIVCLAAVIAL